MNDLSNKLINIISEHGMKYEIFYHDDIFSASEGKDLKLFPSEKVLKTLAFLIDDRFIFAVLRADQQIDYSKLAIAIKSHRKKIKKIPAKTIEELGYQIGGVSPLHLDSRIDTIFDIGAMEQEEVYCGIGARNMTLKMESQDLLSLSQGAVHDISKH